ncbi:SpaH/EbpB family LPXTG-anchored major pilin [Streptococcus halichoeri]|uniref:SpaH/EbpB family LPXTG-anchored major pilin n=1 Tax=Streptococcus halichoeri TaxID=254785 RepID=UPI001359D162
MKKRLIKLLLVVALALGTTTSPLLVPVMAATTGTITVTDTQKGATYSAYKIFDANIADSSASDANKDGVAYMIPAGKEEAYKASDKFDTLFATTVNGGRTYVSKKDNASATDIANWAKVISAKETPVKTATENDADGSEVLTVSDYGYYYVASDVNNGAVVMVTSVSPNATIHEKNTNASWGDGGGKTVDQTSYSVGDTIKYTITYKNAVNYDGAQKVYQYVLKDKIPDAAAIALNKDYTVTVTDAAGQITTLTQGTDKSKGHYSLTETNDAFTLTIPWASTNTPTGNNQNGAADDFFYKGINTITVTYTGVLKKAAKPGSGDLPSNTNTATINPNDKTDAPSKSVTVREGQITIKKVDGSSNAALSGAVFILKNAAGQFLDFSNPDDVAWGSQDQATEYKTDADGLVTITGLKEGTYYLVEKKAPAGYNLLSEPQAITLGSGASDATNSDNLLVTPTVKNNKGSELPSTGGIGTILFYAIGGILVITVGVIFVAKRRLQS